MLRKNYEADWERKKRYLIRTMFEEPPALSPIRESEEPKSRGPSTSADGAIELPELIVERVPKRRNGESAHFYHHLRKRMRKYYRKIFNLRTDDSSSGTEFDEEVYDEYNPEYTIVTHQDDLNVSYVIEHLDRESDVRDKSTLYLGSLSSRKDSSEKERVSVSKSSGSEKRQIDQPGSKDVECEDIMESFVRADKGRLNADDSQDIDLRLSEESNMIRHSGHLEYPNVEQIIQVRKDSNHEIILPETAVDIVEERSTKLSNMDLETVKSVVKYLQTKVDSSRRRSDGDSTNVLHRTEDVEQETKKNDQYKDLAGKRREEDSDEEEKSADDEMETEEELDQLGENQEECDDEEESSKEECERNDSKSDQMSKSQDNEEEESELAEEDSDQSTEEVEIMRSYNPAPSIDSLCHEAPSDTEENTSLNRFTHRHSLPQNEVESPDAAVPRVPETQATDDDEFNFLLRTSTPRKSKEMGTKRPSDLVHEEETTAKKKYFRNIRLQTDVIEKQVSCINVSLQTDSIHVRHFGIQTDEKPAVNKIVGTQTDLPLGDYRNIGIQVALQKKLRSIEVQTDIILSKCTNVQIQTDGTEFEQKDAETQADLRQEGVNDVGVQTDERRREDRSYEFFERRGIFFFFF